MSLNFVIEERAINVRILNLKQLGVDLYFKNQECI